MGLFGNLFSGGPPEEKAAKAQAKAYARAKQDAEERAEKAARMAALLDRAMGNDPNNRGCDVRRRAAIQLVLMMEAAKGREAWLSIGRDYPTELADALTQVGVCFHLEKDYRSALENIRPLFVSAPIRAICLTI